MKLRINGHEIRLIQPHKARNRDVIRLQEQSGLTLSEIAAAGFRSDTHAMVLLSFLSQANAGMEPDYQVLLDGDLEVLGEFIAEAGDPTPEGAPDPQGAAPAAGSATPEPDAAAEEPAETTPGND